MYSPNEPRASGSVPSVDAWVIVVRSLTHLSHRPAPLLDRCLPPFASAQRWEIGATAGVSHGALNGGQEFVWNAAAPTTSLFMRRGLTARLSMEPEVADEADSAGFGHYSTVTDLARLRG